MAVESKGLRGGLRDVALALCRLRGAIVDGVYVPRDKAIRRVVRAVSQEVAAELLRRKKSGGAEAQRLRGLRSGVVRAEKRRRKKGGEVEA